MTNPSLAFTRVPGVLRATRVIDRAPRLLARAGLAIVIVTTPIILLAPAPIGIAFDDGQQFLALLLAVAALLVTGARGRGEVRIVPIVLAAALALVAGGLAAWTGDLAARVTVGGPSVGLFGAAILVFGGVLVWVSLQGMPRARFLAVALESLIIVATVTTLLAAFWGRFIEPTGADADLRPTLLAAIAVVAGPGGTYLALLDRRVRPGLWGPFALIDGLTIGGFAWLGWQMLVSQGTAQAVSPFDPLLSVAILLVAWAGITWSETPEPAARFVEFARIAPGAFAIAAVALCITLSLIVTSGSAQGVVLVGTAAVVAMTLARQVLLIQSERRTHLAEQASTRRLAREVTHRAAVIASLGDLSTADTPEATARDVCVRATALDGIDWAIVMAFESDGSVRVLAELGPVPVLPAGHRRSRQRSAFLAARTAEGPWFEDLEAATDEHLVAMREAGIRRVASAPITSGEHLIGVIRLGGTRDDREEALAERLVAAREFGAVAGALLAPGLDRQAVAAAARAGIGRVIADGAFHPVFQPIVSLDDGRVVGYEALTRFTDGTRPDHRFAEAAFAGMGIDLEMATLAAAIRASVALPPGAYVSLNVSPELACHPSGVVAALGDLHRDVVLEITEHAAVESYGRLRRVLDEFGDHVRIAVDDAGAGFAGLQHILEIGPDLVKLDIALVRGVDTDPARRALIGGMVAFARDTGSALVAEGVETPGEAKALRDLGVALGQGFWFGRPAPAGTTGPAS